MVIRIKFKYKRRISIVLESNSKGAIDKIANKYFKPKIADNDEEDKENFVSVRSSVTDCRSGRPTTLGGELNVSRNDKAHCGEGQNQRVRNTV